MRQKWGLIEPWEILSGLKALSSLLNHKCNWSFKKPLPRTFHRMMTRNLENIGDICDDLQKNVEEKRCCFVLKKKILLKTWQIFNVLDWTDWQFKRSKYLKTNWIENYLQIIVIRSYFMKTRPNPFHIVNRS